MKLLWLGRTIPLPLDAGDRVYTACLVQAVAAAGADITFIGLAPEREALSIGRLGDGVTWVPVGGGLDRQFRFLFSSLPMASVRYGTKEHKIAVKAALRRDSWDVVVLDQYSLVWALDILEEVGFRGVVVHIGHDFETQVTRDIADAFAGGLARRRLLRMNASRTAKAEIRLAKASHIIVTLTDKDAHEFRKLAPGARMVVVPPGYNGHKVAGRRMTGDLPRRVVTVGSFDWTAKQLNLRRFLQTADAAFAREGIEFHVIGRLPPDLQASFAGCKATRFLGFVEDLSAELDAARGALVFDETGGGFKLKMLDYLFARVPIFGLGEVIGVLPPEIARNTAMAPTMAGLVDRVIERIGDIDTLDAMQNGAAAAAKGHFEWAENGRVLLEAIEAELAVPSRA